MLAESSTNEWSAVTDPVSATCFGAFAVLFLGGNVLMAKTRSWTKARHHALVIFSTVPLFIDMLAYSGVEQDMILLAVVGWLAIVVPLIAVIQMAPLARVDEDHELRWDLKKKRK